ncbi:CBS domain containing protein [Candidatus Vecturithrix granuli]|uniref:CBS domain containing protein n=1 Tax=Vecturithrix granuli TaxID=1499967 RepID=A0A081BX18_VECG1|nr:CBS domain containing protein [Candidatus Vecturithrix granuli]
MLIAFMDYPLYLVGSFLCLFLVVLVSFWSHRKHTIPSSQTVSSNIDSDANSSSLDEEEQKLIQNIKEFQDGIVREVMIPRIDMIAVEESTPLHDFRLLAVEKGHSRIPVYKDTIDHIVGVAYVKDMLRYWDTDESTITVAAFMRPPYFVPETKNIGDLLHEFQAKKVHIAVAIDEYGGTAGIVTIEDLLEVIFGDIVDEHDEEEEALIKVIDENTLEVSAKAGIDELEEYVGELVIEQQDFDTVGGLLFAILGDIPEENKTVEFQHLRFTILKADRQRILQVKVEWNVEPVVS